MPGFIDDERPSPRNERERLLAQLDEWRKEYNVALANGLYMKAQPIKRRIKAIEKVINNG